MVSFLRAPRATITLHGLNVPNFVGTGPQNLDASVVESFGEEWTKFDSFDPAEVIRMSNEYFDVLPEEALGQNIRALDAGCGMGRWSYALAEKVGWIDAIDPSEAALSAAKLLASKKNVRVSRAEINDLPFPAESYDLVICLGVLHHMPNTAFGLRALHNMIKPGGGILLYLYYALEFRPIWFRAIFLCVNSIRGFVSSLPHWLKKIACEIIALLVYFPLASFAALAKRIFSGSNWPEKIPLSSYSNKSFRIMRLDALDRFGTSLEKRFTKAEIASMLAEAGFSQPNFSNHSPFWHVYARKS